MPVFTWINQHRGWSVSISVLLLIVIGVAAAYFFFFRTTTTPLDLRQAIRLYRERQSTSWRHLRGMPNDGVYEYSTSGQEGLSVLGINRHYPDRTTMIITGASGGSGRPPRPGGSVASASDGSASDASAPDASASDASSRSGSVGQCATVQWEPVTQHIEGTKECRESDGSVAFRSATTLEQIAGITTRTVMTCPAGTFLRPPEPQIRQRWTTTCHQKGETVRAVGEVVGFSKVQIAGSAVPALHTKLIFYFRGSATGSSPTDYWLALQSNLILRQREKVHVSQQTGPLGSVVYSEEMSAQLLSLGPKG